MSAVSVSTLPASGAVRGCGRPDCDVSRVQPVDLFCRSHNSLLLLNGAPQWLINAIGAGAGLVIWAGFLATPALHNVIPLYLVLVAIGWAVVAVPLRTFPVAGPSVSIGWLLASVLAPLLRRPASLSFEITMTLFVAGIAVAWMVRLSRTAYGLNRAADSAGGIRGAALAATLVGVAIGCFVTWLAIAIPVVERFLRLARGMAPWLLLLSVVAAGLAILSVAGFAVVHSSAGWPRAEDRPLAEPRRPRSLKRSRRTAPARPGAPGGSLGILDNFSRVLLLLMLSIADLVIYICYYRVAKILVAMANWVILWLINVAHVTAWAGTLLAQAAWSATRVMVLPAVSMLLAARALLAFAYTDERYIATGGLLHLVVLLALAAVAFGLLMVAWIAVSAMELYRLWSAVVDTLSVSAAMAIILLCLGGWVIGLFGTFGPGPIRVGWLTLGSTACIVIVSVVLALRRSEPEGRDAA